jgi:hypothetical protein
MLYGMRLIVISAANFFQFARCLTVKILCIPEDALGRIAGRKLGLIT